MDQLIQCPVCTLYLHNGMTLETHLDTHPKDQVIKALCNLTSKGGGSNYTSRAPTPRSPTSRTPISRTPTPNTSEQSYQSRSRTPVVDERWTSSHHASDRYFRRAPTSRIAKSNLMSNDPYIDTPDNRSGEYQFDNNVNDDIPYSGTPYTIISDKNEETYANVPSLSDIDQQYVYYNETQEDREIKYSKSEDYSPLDSTSSVFTHNLPAVSSGIKMHTTLLSALPRRGNENIVKMIPKPNNIFLKTNRMQYITPGVKPIQMTVPNTSTFVQKNLQNNMYMTSTISGGTMINNKGPTFAAHQLNQMSNSRITPGTTVVQNSQIIYRETVHNIDGKRFITCAPSILNRENVTNVSQATSMYQNVVVLDRMGNSSCIYKTPQPIITKPSPSSLYGNSFSKMPPITPPNTEEFKDIATDSKSIIIEVEPVSNFNYANSITTQTDTELPKSETREILSLDRVEKSETPGPCKGLKILSNIKVEVPVQHNKYMVNTVLDLTGSDYLERADTPEKNIVDISDKDIKHDKDIEDDNDIKEDKYFQQINQCIQPIALGDSVISNTFSVIKNIGNPHSYTDAKSTMFHNKIDIEFSDSCPVPDLICNEKPSISPCSELSVTTDNSNDNTSVSSNLCSSKEKRLENSNKQKIIEICSKNKIFENCNKQKIFENFSKNSPKPSSSKQKDIESNIDKILSRLSGTYQNKIEINVDKSLNSQQKTIENPHNPSSSHQKTIDVALRNSPKTNSSHQKIIDIVTKLSPKPNSDTQKTLDIVTRITPKINTSQQKLTNVIAERNSLKPSGTKQKDIESNIHKILSKLNSSQQNSIEINVEKYSPKQCNNRQKTIDINVDNNSPKPGSSNQKIIEINVGKISPKPSSSKIRVNESNVDKNSPKPSGSMQKSSESIGDKKPLIQQQKSYKHNPLRLNNIFVRKHKKVLQIKNAKTFPTPCTSQLKDEEPRSSDTHKLVENNSNKSHIENKDCHEKLKSLKMITVEEIKCSDGNNDVKTVLGEPSIDIHPIAILVNQLCPQKPCAEEVQVKEETITSNEDVTCIESKEVDISLVSLKPVNIISYGSMAPGDLEEESVRKDLMELEASTDLNKNKKFVSMMKDNYFGDNIYADYFTPDRVETLDAEKDRARFINDGQKENPYFRGEPSNKENELLTNFIHDSYKIADNSGVDYSDMDDKGIPVDTDGNQDSKVDVLSESHSEGDLTLNICTDERMPPHGELSGQESNGDMDSSWGGLYPVARPPSEPYDLIARESWLSDGSEADHNERRKNLEEEVYSKSVQPRPLSSHTCPICGAHFALARDMRAHLQRAHSQPDHRLLAVRQIKKEDKSDDTITGTMAGDSKESLAATILQAYEVELADAKPKIEGFVKEEPRQRKRRDYVCPTCKVDQVTDAAFTVHLKQHPLECLTCGKCFFRRSNLALHVKTHLGIKEFKCEVCEKRFLTKQKLAEHSNIHTGRAPFKCTVCDETFRRYSNMAQHRNRHHYSKKAKVRDFVCQCGAVFHSRAKLEWHRETHAPRPRACLYCSDKFVHAASLTRHVRRAHDACYVPPDARSAPRAANQACPVCKQVYLRTNMRAHLLTHSGKRPYQCIVCNKAFTTKWNLKLHRWTHMNRSAKPFKCTLCKGAFIRHSEFVAHMNAHKSVKPYTCNYCGCQFIRKYNCQRHVKEHEMDKKYVCKVPECGKSFHRSYYLSEHMKVHSGARPFSCNICGKTSSNKSNHNKHVKIHHAREPVATEA